MKPRQILRALFAYVFLFSSVAALVSVGWLFVAQPMMRNHAECGRVTLCQP